MNRRMLALAVGGVVAIVAVVTGTLIAMSQDDDDASVPTGEANELRLEAVNEEVSCGSVAAVRLHLDDLESRESPRMPGAPAGMVGFELPVQYDPSVLRILGSSDIQLNQDIGQQDVDGDGMIREFITLADLDEDHLGRAVIGAASVVPGSQGGEDNLEEGVDPVTRGEPLLLMTVRFTPVGEGTTTIRLEGWELEPHIGGEIGLTVLDADRVKYEPLSVTNTEVTVRGGECPEPPPTQTVRPTSTPLVVPTQTPVRWDAVEPTAAPAAGREDCPQDWAAYTDPQERFSICYPAEYGVTVSEASFNARANREEGVVLSVIVSWAAGSGHLFGPPDPETCRHYTSIVEGPMSSTFVETALADRVTPSCLTVGPQQSSLHGSVPVAADGSTSAGYVHFMANFVAMDQTKVPSEARSIIETLVVGPR